MKTSDTILRRKEPPCFTPGPRPQPLVLRRAVRDVLALFPGARVVAYRRPAGRQMS